MIDFSNVTESLYSISLCLEMLSYVKYVYVTLYGESFKVTEVNLKLSQTHLEQLSYKSSDKEKILV